ncbi:MAG: hypothetical protein FJW36_20900 [Acidobacteria bacterium]|nr:hypothetical protein [Acidobacteriota bacterium]
MWNQLKKILAQRAAAIDSSITVRSQKWLAPSETLRIVDLDCDGDRRRLVLWTTKTGSQMLELASTRETRDTDAGKLSRGASC